MSHFNVIAEKDENSVSKHIHVTDFIQGLNVLYAAEYVYIQYIYIKKTVDFKGPVCKI